MGKRPLPFSWVEAFTKESCLAPGVRHVLHVLAKYMNPRGEAWPSYETIARDTGYSKRHVKRQVKAAARAGWLIVESQGGAKGHGGRSNRYRAAVPAIREPGEARSGDADDTGGDIGVTRVVSPVSLKYPEKAQRRLNSPVRRKSVESKGQTSGERIALTKESLIKGEASLGSRIRLAGLDREEIAWIHAKATTFGVVTAKVGADAFELAAIALLDLARKRRRFTRELLVAFMAQTATLMDGGDTDVAVQIRQWFLPEKKGDGETPWG